MRNIGILFFASTILFACGKKASDSSAAASGGDYKCKVFILQKGAENGPNPTEVKGKGSSSKSEDDACAAATVAACKKAGAADDCVASGAYRQTGKSTESTASGN